MNLENHPKRNRFMLSAYMVQKHIDISEEITDLGVDNDMAKYMRSLGYKVYNTGTADLDLYTPKGCVITSFEVFEHMFAPFNLLLKSFGKLVCSVPLNVWYKREYWNYKDARDCHYHEFTIRQFNHLLMRTGWEIKDRIVWNPDKGIKHFWNRYYFIYAEK